MRMVWVKCSQDNFQVTSLKAGQGVNNEAEDAILAGLEESEVLSDKMEDNFSLHFLKKGGGGHGASSSNGTG